MIEYKDILEVAPEIQEKVRQWRNSPRVKRGMLDQSDITARQHRLWLESLASNPDTNAVRVVFSDGVPFGIINLRGVDRKAGSSDWGIYIGEEAFLGRRLGKRMVYDVHRWGLIDEALNKMYSTVRSDNLRVLHSYLELGNHIEGFLKDHIRLPGGELIGIYLIALFKDEWLKNGEKISSWANIGD